MSDQKHERIARIMVMMKGGKEKKQMLHGQGKNNFMHGKPNEDSPDDLEAMQAESPEMEGADSEHDEDAETPSMQQEEEMNGMEGHKPGLFGKHKGPAIHIMISVGKHKHGRG